MEVRFKLGIGDRVSIAVRGDLHGKVKGLFVGEDGRRQVSVAYVDAAGDPAGPEWFGEDDVAAA